MSFFFNLKHTNKYFSHNSHFPMFQIPSTPNINSSSSNNITFYNKPQVMASGLYNVLLFNFMVQKVITTTDFYLPNLKKNHFWTKHSLRYFFGEKKYHKKTIIMAIISLFVNRMSSYLHTLFVTLDRKLYGIF